MPSVCRHEPWHLGCVCVCVCASVSFFVRSAQNIRSKWTNKQKKTEPDSHTTYYITVAVLANFRFRIKALNARSELLLCSAAYCFFPLFSISSFSHWATVRAASPATMGTNKRTTELLLATKVSKVICYKYVTKRRIIELQSIIFSSVPF